MSPEERSANAKPLADARWRFTEPAFLAGFGFYLLLYHLLSFKGVYVRGDDFAYVESVVESLALGRVVTHDWIGPFNAFFTATGVAAYRLTGNFYLSTYGVLSLFAAANFLLFFAWFRARLESLPAACLTLAAVSFPFYLHKSLDYHGCLPTLTCFLAALLAFNAGRHALFFLAASLAVSTRQNSLVLFLLPVYAIGAGYLRDRRIDWRLCAYLALSMIALGAGRLYLNDNWFNRSLQVLPDEWPRAVLIARQFGVGVFLGMLFLTVSNLALGSGRPAALLRENLRRYPLPLAFTLLFAWLAFGHPASLVWFQTPLIGSFDHGGRLQLVLKAGVLLSFWFLDRRLLRWNIWLFLGLGYVGISCLLGFFWDYYLSEIALIALWIVLRSLPPKTASTDMTAMADITAVPTGARRGFTPSWSPKLAFGALMAANLGYAYLYKVHLDKLALADVAFEKLERQGRLTPERMTGATFGFLGFKVFRLIVEDHPDHGFDDFTCYVQGDGAVVESGLPWRRRLSPPSPAVDVLDSGSWSIGYLELPYRVVDRKNPRGLNICHGEFKDDGRARTRSRPFPLDNAEWREFIRKARR